MQRRPNLRLIEGGGAQSAQPPTPAPSPSSKSGAPSGLGTRAESAWGCDPSKTKREIRVVVCGSRTWNDLEPIGYMLAGLQSRNPDADIVVAHGGAQGADEMGGTAARLLGMKVEVFPADWDRHGRKAGFLRNQQMVQEFYPDLVFAFSEHPITKGTAHTVRLAQAEGIPVLVTSHPPG